MDFHFASGVTLKESDDPFLGEILRECDVEAHVRVHCSSYGDDIDFAGLELDYLDFSPPDSPALLKTRVLLGRELDGRILIALEAQVAREWDRYYDEAAEELQGIHEANMEARYDHLRDR